MGAREYGLLAPGMKKELRVTTDPVYYEEHSENLELWSPGNPLFQAPEHTADDVEPIEPVPGSPNRQSLSGILDRG